MSATLQSSLQRLTKPHGQRVLRHGGTKATSGKRMAAESLTRSGTERASLWSRKSKSIGKPGRFGRANLQLLMIAVKSSTRMVYGTPLKEISFRVLVARYGKRSDSITERSPASTG